MVMHQSTMLARSTAIGQTRSPAADHHELYWQERLETLPFYIAGLSFEDYAPAFRLGHERYRDDTLFEDVRCRYGAEWDRVKGNSRLRG
jgi:hypothetical protein